MSERIAVSEARAVLSELVGRVLDGEEITLTRHGQDVAVLISPNALRQRRNREVFEAAEQLRQQLEVAKDVPLAPGGLPSQLADEWVRELHADRKRR